MTGPIDFNGTAGDHGEFEWTSGNGTTGDVWSLGFYQNSAFRASIDFFATTEAAGDGNIRFKSGNITTLTLDSSQNATFAGDVNVQNNATRIISLNYEDSVNSIISHSGNNFGLESLNVRGDTIRFYTDYDASSPKGNLTLTLDTSHNATFAGDVILGTGDNLYLNGTTGLRLLHDGSNALFINQTVGDVKIQNSVSDKDIIFRGKDGASTITALTLDMSDNGWGLFNAGINLGTISNATSDTDKFLVSDGGDIEYRTGAQVLSDIGGAPAVTGGYLPLSAGSGFPLTGDLYLKTAPNEGNLFFGTSSASYKIFGGGTYGYMGYDTGGYHRFLVSGSEEMRITSGNLIFNGSANILSNTSDGADNAQIIISGGGGTPSADTRGASIHLAGNEHGNAGLLQLRAGDGTVGGIRLYEGGSERMRIAAGNTIIRTSTSIGTTVSPTRTLDVRGTGLNIFGSGGNTELMLRGQVEGTGTVRNLGAWHWSVRPDVGGDNDDLKLLRFITGTFSGTAMQIQNSTGDIFFGNTVVNPASGFSNQKGFGYDTSTGNLEVASTSGTPMTIGRNESTAGEILVLRKEGTVTHEFGSTDSYLLGNVGIGTTTPNNLLSLRKDVADGDVAIYLQNYNSVIGSTNETVSIKFAHGNDSGTGYVGAAIVGGKEGDFESNPSNVKGFISFNTNNGSVSNVLNERMRIEAGGNVGIGTTSPTYKLSVSGGIEAGGLVTYSKVAGSLSTTGYAVAGLTAGFNGASAGFEFKCYGSNSKYQRIVYSCHCSGTTWVPGKVIDEGTNDLDVVASANGATITFTFKARSSTQNFSPRIVIQATGHSINSTYA